ncbi:MAG: phage tail assembly chaperone [Parvularculaceae bacterium]
MSAVTDFGLSPAAFWSLTIGEWRWLAGAAGGAPGAKPCANPATRAEPMTRADLSALLQQYPDEAP